MEIQLIKRNYLGPGYLHWFREDSTGNIYVEECTKEEYERLGQPGGSQFNPVKSGFHWIGSDGGTIKVDTPSSMLGQNEYCDLGDLYAIRKDKGIGLVDKKDIVDDKIDSEIKLK